MLKAHTTFIYDLCSTHTPSLIVSVLRFDDSFSQFPANPLLLSLAVTRNFSLHFCFQRFFSINLRGPRCKEEGAPRCSSSLGAKFPLPFFLTPYLFICSWRPLLHPPIQQFFFKKILYKFNVCVGFGWAVEIDLRINHFSLFLPSPAWVVCRPRAFLSLKENTVVYGRGQHFQLLEFNCTNDTELTRKDGGFGGHRLHRSRLEFLLCDEPWHQNELNNRLKDYWGRAECKSKISRSFLS